VHWLLENDVGRQFQDANDEDESNGETSFFLSFLFATDGATVDIHLRDSVAL